MKTTFWITTFGIATLALAAVFGAGVSFAAGGPPAWAYGIPPEGTPPPPPAKADDGTKIHRTGSTGEFTLNQLRDGFGPADWYPGDHPAMPDIVAHGKKAADIRACSLCHYPNGKGRPENAGISGLSVSYFMQQIQDFKNGNRASAEKKKANTNFMIAYAKGMTDEEVKQAAEYFAQIKWTTPWIKVVEASTIPKTRLAGGMYLVVEGGGKEPLGQRIVETPVDAEATELLRDPRSSFIAYVPVGSIKKGQALVTTGGGKTTQCGVCHGPDLKGVGPVPSIAGRSPSYLVRQLYDMQEGTRNGTWTALMKPVVSKLSEEDMLNIAAYTASRMP